MNENENREMQPEETMTRRRRSPAAKKRSVRANCA